MAVLLGTRQDEGKVMLMAGLSRDLVERGLDAVQWVRAAARRRSAAAAAAVPIWPRPAESSPDKLPEALEAGRAAMAKLLGEATGSSAPARAARK